MTSTLAEFTMPLKTVSALNVREHHFARSSRVEREHKMTTEHLEALGESVWDRCFFGLPLRITLTRISPKAQWLPLKGCYESTDDDAVPGAMKGVRDAIAAWLGIDDGDQRLWFSYAQDRGPMGVRVHIEQAEKREPLPDPRQAAPKKRRASSFSTAKEEVQAQQPLFAAIARDRAGENANVEHVNFPLIVRKS